MSRMISILLVLMVQQAYSGLLKAPDSLSHDIDSALSVAIERFEQSKFDQSQQALEWAKDRSMRSNNLYDLAEVYNWLGNVHQETGNLHKSAEYYKEGLRIAELFDDHRLINRLRINHAMSMADSENVHKSIELLQRAELYFAHDDEILIAVHNNLGYCYLRTGGFHEGRVHLLKAAYLAEKLQDTARLAEIYTNLGQNWYNEGDLDEAAHHYHRALDKYIALGRLSNIESIYLSLFEIYKANGKKDEAVQLMKNYLTSLKDVPESHAAGIEQLIASAETGGIGPWQMTFLIAFALSLLAVVILAGARVRVFQQNNLVISNYSLQSVAPLAGHYNGRLLEVYYRLGKGESQKEICLSTKWSSSTISDDVKRIKEMLAVENIQAHAIRSGVSEMDWQEFKSLIGKEMD